MVGFFELKDRDPRVRATDLYIYSMLFIFPLFTGFWGYNRVTDSKFAFFAAATLAWLTAILALSRGRRNLLSFRRAPAAEKFVLLYLALCVVSTLFSPYRVQALIGAGRYDGLLTTALCCAAFLGAGHYARPKAGYVYAAALAGSLNCAVALLQLSGFNPLWLFPDDCNFYDAGVRFSSVFLGTIGNADLFAAYLCLILPLTGVYYITAERRPLPLLAAFGLSALCLLASGVSGGMLALAVFLVCTLPFLIGSGERLRRMLELAAVLFLAAFFSFPLHVSTPQGGGAVRIAGHFSALSPAVLTAAAAAVLLRFMTAKKEFRSRHLKRIFAAFSLACVAGSCALVYFWSGTDGTLYELSQVLHGHLEDRFGSSRILIWRKVLALFPAHPLLGGGPGTLPLRLDLQFTRHVAETGGTITTYVDNAHNVYLGILVNTGIFSLAACLGAALFTLRGALRAQKSSFAAPLACALLCFWVQDFFDLGLFIVTPMMWILWGLLTGDGQRERERHAKSACILSRISRLPAPRFSDPSKRP